MTAPVYEEAKRRKISARPVPRRETADGGGPNLLRVLTYHRVAELTDSPLLDPRIISTTPAIFEQQMRYLASNFSTVSLKDVLNAVEGGGSLAERAVLITFDDGYGDFTEYAWPILKKYRLPATIFVPTAYPDRLDRAFWWDRLYRALSFTSHTELRSTPIAALPLGTKEERRQSLRRLQNYLKTIPDADALALVDHVCDELDSEPISLRSVLSWDELRALADEGVTLCAHSQTHPILTQLSVKRARQEIVGSQLDLQREIGHVLPVFCYPDGAHDEAVINVLREEGFVLAFTTLEGRNDLNDADLLRLHRMHVGKRTSATVFRLRLSRLGNYLNRWYR
jgi:peptidoglycan/xylan/chitin deacetylase (PgdA/CDA1 family)